MGTERRIRHPTLSSTSPSRLGQLTVASVVLLVFFYYYCFVRGVPEHLDTAWGRRQRLGLGTPPPEVLNNRFLTASQCAAAFPGLTKEVDDFVAKGPFTLEPSGPLGPLIARIRDGKLSILQYTRKSDLSKEMLQHRSATLHQLSNALLTSPSAAELPDGDTILAINHHDNPVSPSLSYSRPAANHHHLHHLPMPHFGLYSWPVPHSGGSSLNLAEVSKSISAIEAATPWRDKIPKALWRGTAHFNNPQAGARLRQDLVLATKDKTWADIEALRWTGTPANASNAVPLADFCRHRYVIYTEGITYSGRLPFHQLCASVTLSPPLAWMMHMTHLARPVLSRDLLKLDEHGVQVEEPPQSESKATNNKDPAINPWTKPSRPPNEANMVFVAPDWSDLEVTVLWLERHPDVAAGIARRQREAFYGGGYYSPAAEACYWRAAARGWAKVVRVEHGEFDDMEGMSWEEFSLREIHK